MTEEEFNALAEEELTDEDLSEETTEDTEDTPEPMGDTEEPAEQTETVSRRIFCVQTSVQCRIGTAQKTADNAEYI